MNIRRTLQLSGDILIVDDQPQNLQVLSRMLTDQGYRVRKAINGESALIAVKQEPPDIILLDIMMPNMDGYQVCQVLKADQDICDIPVIFLSAFSEVSDKVKAFQIGGVDYIVKPFQAEEVVSRVQVQLTIQQQRQQLKQEIEKRKQAEEALKTANKALQTINIKLQRIANLDGLTGIANRRFFNEKFLLEWENCFHDQSPLSLILADVDYFKLYNDTYGHQQGDDCLIQIAKILVKSARLEDIVARYGGEEFAIILPNTSPSEALKVAESIRTAVYRLKIVHEKSEISSHVTLSLGLASVVPKDDNQQMNLISQADQALYEAKHQGRNCIVIYQPMI